MCCEGRLKLPSSLLFCPPAVSEGGSGTATKKTTTVSALSLPLSVSIGAHLPPPPLSAGRGGVSGLSSRCGRKRWRDARLLHFFGSDVPKCTEGGRSLSPSKPPHFFFFLFHSKILAVECAVGGGEGKRSQAARVCRKMKREEASKWGWVCGFWTEMVFILRVSGLSRHHKHRPARLSGFS